MGWLFTSNTSRKDLIEARTRSWENLSVPKEWFERQGVKLDDSFNRVNYRLESTCLKYCYRGSAWKGTLWKVWDHKAIEKATGEVIASELWIGCDLCEYSKSDNGWGYKDMDESMGPSYYNCPLSYLDLTPVVNPEWRESVRFYWGYRGKLKVGEKVDLHSRCQFSLATIVSLKPLRCQVSDGSIYKISRKNIIGIHEGIKSDE